MKRLNFSLVSDAPLIMHSDLMVDPFNELTKAKKKLTAKRANKTEDDLHEIDRIEFMAGLYMRDDLGPVIPGANVERMLFDAAKRTKSGMKAKMGLQVSEQFFPLLYDGPRDAEGLWKTPRFQFRKSIKQGTSRIMRVRPWFHEWKLDVAIDFDEKTFDASDISGFMDVAGRYVGLCDWRPRFGRFHVEKVTA